ncbi:hypothetical protein GPECTOR_119g402 [Gonium pectorale]|uniref:D-xylose 1-dehydrogenase (NADP(+), D-xylono-1,5-lactone-forming) n=1 Tax=Gonium pectorale TaxID=33097 RepID=A0A150FYT5_GONPE|nr:hypothetical protein GPECTOR_119g402 [Gonium pectorale]|eukprot:KXZ42771.1 hypothetical protein GPECTOR_119g402 [Gonium pectorale]
MVWPSRRVAQAEVVAVAARDGSRAKEYAKQHGIASSYGSYEALLADPDVDAVYVGLPNGLHGQWARAALEAGKHVLCEKPFTANEEEAREVQALARKRGLVCREAFHYREHPLMEHLQSVLCSPGAAGKAAAPGLARRAPVGAPAGTNAGDDQAALGGVLGRLSAIDVAVLIPKWVFGGANIRFQETLAGGAAMDAGCYCLHSIRSLIGGKPQVESATATLAPNSQVVDGSMRGALRWDDPHRSSIRATFTASLQHDGLFPTSTISVRGDKGSLQCSNFIMPVFGNFVRLTTRTEAGDTTTTTTRVYGSGESTYYYQLSRFVRDVQAVQEAAASGDAGALVAASNALAEEGADSIENMRLLDQVYTAAGLAPRLPSALAIMRQLSLAKAQPQETATRLT